MKPGRVILSSIMVAASLAATVGAHAQDARLVLAANDFVAPAPAPTTPGRTLEWDSKKGRWGLRLGVEQRYDREPQLRDLAPGVFYKVTPRLHIGGAVTLAPDAGEGLDFQHLNSPQAPNPRVRLETTFKF